MEIMYQGYQHYPLSVYQNHAFSAGFKAFTRMHEPLQGVGYRCTGSLPKFPASQLSINEMPPTTKTSTEEPRRHKDARENSRQDGEELPEAEYIHSHCVLYTYFTEDINKVVDDHFSRALNGPSSFAPAQQRGGDKGNNNPSWKARESEHSSLMIQRNLPPSFWNSGHYRNPSAVYSTSQNAAVFGSDSSPYFSYTHHVHQPDPWHYTSYAAHTSHRRQMELAYSNSAFSPHYNSLLIQPSVRHAGRLAGPGVGGATELAKTSDSWRNYSTDYSNSSVQHEYTYPGPPPFITETAASTGTSSSLATSIENEVAPLASRSSTSWF